ncbi:hypothetical protein JAAARDRAFT_160480 [Jaapia argillacea MUCL 33604]|uniref:PIH1 N-terminal domain-containing protein n=1 Tax=Jaapia argillacea MUCL 33604 TaxID=933084 RepID=A0A067PHW2_9AGAM|nr:hypothetical protein JAAARDRAFT_160480 [Jaapia argillacea MUCL 33604]
MRDSSYETPTGDMFVPAIVSAPRPEKDKAGNPCLVFDCVFNSSLKSSSLKDPEFKAFLTELALQRVEAQAAVPLSRNIGTPNIRSKGPIPPRTVSIPSILYPPNHPIRSDSTPVENTTPTTGKKLIQEIQTPLPPPNAPLQSAEISSSPSTEEIPTWFWTQDDQDIRITVHVPKLTRSHISSATIDIESNRLIFCVPSLYVLDINTAATSEPPSQDTTSSKQIAGLKIQRPFAVDTARAEFRVAEGLLVVFV